MPRNFGPMLAAQFGDDELFDLFGSLQRRIQFPVLASPKIDGIRFMVQDGVALSRTWKPLPNRFFQDFIKTNDEDLEGLDGEVIVGQDPSAISYQGQKLFNATQSAIMTSGGSPDFSLHLFDFYANPRAGFGHRHMVALDTVKDLNEAGFTNVYGVPHTLLRTAQEVLDYEQECLEAGYEGIMLRHPNVPYKHGRSTLKEQGLIKIKRFNDAEAKIVGFKPLERNTNPPEKDAFGLQKRSSHRAGKVADELLGKLVVTQQPWGEFEIGSGFDVATREEIWKNQEAYLGKTVTFKYQAHGTQEKPRAPIFKGFRPEVD
jgi:DNA ligase-1